MNAVATVEGQGLHSGAPARVRFVREPGAVRLRAWRGGEEARVDELAFDGSARSTSAFAEDGRLRVGTVEHLFAALGALSVYEGVVVEIDGPELPLLDGGARAFLDVLEGLGARPSAPRLIVARAGAIAVGASLYELRPSDELRPSGGLGPTDGLGRSDGRRVDVEIDFGDPRLERVARWAGDIADFRDRVAPARTFGFEREVDELLARGLASHVAPESVVVIGRDRILSAGRPFAADEPARHKLLDLVGDLYAYGGPPIGCVRAVRPGHAATHEAVRRALSAGLLART